MKNIKVNFVRAKIILLTSVLALAALAGCGKTDLSDAEHVQRAKDYQDQGDLNASVIELKSALKQKPDNPEARWLLGKIYVDMENGAAAEKELVRARELGVDPAAVVVPLGKSLLMQGKAQRLLDEINVANNAPAAVRAGVLTLRGEAHLNLKKIEAAQSDLSAALEACGDGKCIDTLLALSSLEMGRNDPAKAREWLIKASAQDPKNGNAWRYLGNLEQAQNRTQEALEAYGKAIQINSRDMHALFDRAQLHLQEGKIDASKADVEAMRKVAPRHPAIRYIEGRHALMRKDYAPAQAALETFVKANPHHPPAAYYLAMAHAAQGHWQQAEEQLARLFSSYPDSMQIRKMLALVQAQRGAPDDAIKTLAPAVKQTTNDLDAIKLLGRLYLRTGDLQTGIGYLQREVEAEPGLAGTRLELGQALQAQGKTDLALAQFDAALQIKPDLTEADVLRIFTHLRERQFDAALQAVAEFKARHPKSPVPDSLAASAYTSKKDYAQARQSLERALALDSRYLPARLALARLALLQNDAATARRHYQNILKQDSGHLDSLLALMALEDQAGKQKEAIAWLEKARQKHPKAVAPALLMISTHLQQNEPLKALTLARDTRNDHPDNAAVLQALAQSQLAAGEVSSAISSLRNLTEKLPKSPQAHYLLGDAYLRMKDAKAAATSLNTALRLNPAFLPATIALSTLELRNNRPQEALRLARRVQQQQPTAAAGYELEGNAYMRTRAYAEAAKAYAAAYQRVKSSGLVVELSGARRQAGDIPGAYQALTQWLAEHPDDLTVRAALAATYQSDGKHPEAVAHYQKILEKQPKNALVLNELSWIYFVQGDARALQYAEKAYTLAPDQPAVIDTLGWALVQKGEVKRGLELLEKAADKAPAIPVIRYHYAAALDKAGRSREARQALEELLAKEKNFPDVQEARKLLEKLQHID